MLISCLIIITTILFSFICIVYLFQYTTAPVEEYNFIGIVKARVGLLQYNFYFRANKTALGPNEEVSLYLGISGVLYNLISQYLGTLAYVFETTLTLAALMTHSISTEFSRILTNQNEMSPCQARHLEIQCFSI